ncbi:MAG TPA: hypothetical protein VHG28_20485, partial [Longimicrobiaceae bacterium]|nr:hypothetical protein [Longimicrobiaceae bacterium]
MALQEAIQRYHELLTEELAAESQAQLDDQQRRRGLFFGDKPLATVLRPRFFTPEQYRLLQSRVAVVMRAFGKAYRAAMESAEFRAQFRLMEWEEELVHTDPGFRAPSPTSRLDAFFISGKGGLKFTEYNAETPAAPAYNDALTEVFLGLPVMREFTRIFQLRTLPARHGVMHVLVDAYRQFSGRWEMPHIAILDWPDVPTYSEFVLFREYFESQGIPTVIGDPREAEYRDGKLMLGDFHVTLIYKRVLINELVEECGLDSPVVRAVRDGAVCMVNPFRCKILHKKASLAVLSDEANAHLFTGDELESIAAHIPWTRNVEERRTTFGGEEVDLVSFIRDNAQRLVLKPNDDYGGRGIVLGWEADSAQWEEAVRTALAEPYIVQERVELPKVPYPSMVDGRVELFDRMLDTAPFIFHGEYMDGC